MICEKCKKVEATVHLTEIIKNVKSELHLCENCAKEFGLNSRLSNFSLSVPDILSFLNVDEIGDLEDTRLCLNCGMTFLEYRKIGKLGCSVCYQYLETALESIIFGFHGENKHIGKIPHNYLEKKPSGLDHLDNKPVLQKEIDIKKEDIAELKIKLENAVLEERYEEAAILRDKILEIESGNRK